MEVEGNDNEEIAKAVKGLQGKQILNLYFFCFCLLQIRACLKIVQFWKIKCEVEMLY